jgi:ectoine hydroxylase-related dioxygenase (phytanoyl-CoA dioxygenase family)
MHNLTEEEHQFYRENGYLLAPDLLTAEEIKRFAAAVAEEYEGHSDISAEHPAQNPNSYEVLSEDCLSNPDINFAVDHPDLCRRVETLLGKPARLSAFAIHVKLPGWTGTIGDYQGSLDEGHCDYKPFRPVGSSLNWLFTIIPLVDYTDEIGPLLVSPGSHRHSRLIENKGRVTLVERADGKKIPPFVNLNLKKGQVVFLNMFTWHKAFPNRSKQIRFGMYNKYMAVDAPPGTGPYLFSDDAYRRINYRGSDLLANHSDRLIGTTRLILERDNRVMLQRSAEGLWFLPGGLAQTERKKIGSDDDNVIAFLYEHLEHSLNLRLPWVTYVGDYPEDHHLCRTYGYPLAPDAPDPGSETTETQWFSESEIHDHSNTGSILCGWEADAVKQWFNAPVIRGIAQPTSQSRVGSS